MAKKYCCKDLEKYLTNDCPQHGLRCPDNVVQRFTDKYKDNIGIPHLDGSYYKINYCPWCGTKIKFQ